MATIDLIVDVYKRQDKGRIINITSMSAHLGIGVGKGNLASIGSVATPGKNACWGVPQTPKKRGETMANRTRKIVLRLSLIHIYHNQQKAPENIRPTDKCMV